MSNDKPWGNMNPNSSHQLWSHWTFEIWEYGPKHLNFKFVFHNFKEWANKAFGSVGEVRGTEKFVSDTDIPMLQVVAHDMEPVTKFQGA